MPTHRKPAKLKILEGKRGKREIPQELQARGVPTPPDYLSPAQLDRWKDIIESLPDKYLSRADIETLERMAIAWAQFREATIQLNKSMILVAGANKEPVRNPLLIVQYKAAEIMAAAGMELGLSPLARTRLTQPENVDDDPLDTLLGPYGKAWGDESFQTKN